ncbi:uncharacterized protein LOC142985092 [Anticarsia gemmatalis]|uniref:uncharacterized protein LOC142985092 n=1 Tax=Anticarsia gemmatalis TaxID=129554 RepID=UPI003F77609B
MTDNQTATPMDIDNQNFDNKDTELSEKNADITLTTEEINKSTLPNTDHNESKEPEHSNTDINIDTNTKEHTNKNDSDVTTNIPNNIEKDSSNISSMKDQSNISNANNIEAVCTEQSNSECLQKDGNELKESVLTIEISSTTDKHHNTGPESVLETDQMTDIKDDSLLNSDIIETGNNVIILGSKKADTSSKKRLSKLDKELISLGVTEVKEEAEFDVYEDDSNRIYKNYRLRKTVKKPDYRIPTTIEVPKAPKSPKEETINCPQCDREFFTKSDLRTHIKMDHNLTYTCSLCLQTFETNAQLVTHKQIHKNDQSFLCHQCKVAFSDHYDYLLHRSNHSKPHDFLTCPECGLSFQKQSYQIHILTHFDKPLTCHICSKTVNGEHNLQCHINKHAVKLECVECGKICNEKSSYDKHMDMHTGVKRYQCLYCGKCFRTSCQRNIHSRRHTDVKPFKCNICSNTFRQKTDLERHIAAHERIKKFKCDICDKKYLHKPDLVAHKRSHTSEDLYPCPECDRRFTTMTGVKVHVLFVHTTERPVECKLCNKGFINNNQFLKHSRSKYHKRNVFKKSLDEKN